jgi:hypothetical protein
LFSVERNFILATLLGMLCGAGCESRPAAPAKPFEPAWREVGRWSGRGNQQLETFPIERMTWRVRWQTTNEREPGAGRFHVTANSGDSGRSVAEIANVNGVGRDVTYVTDLPRRYYFVVTSSGVDWSLTAEEQW